MLKNPDDAPAAADDKPDLGFDPEAVLLHDLGALIEPSFLSVLYGELVSDLGEAAAPVALLQIGFLHGLRDAMRVVGDAFGTGRYTNGAQAAPALPLRFRASPARDGDGIELRGTWLPERLGPFAGEESPILPEPGCAMRAGYTSGWLSGTLDSEILAMEDPCRSGSGQPCGFVAMEAGVWRALGDERATALLDALPLDTFRTLAHDDLLLSSPEASGFDPEAAVVHIWGPVMVIPYAGPDEALQALDLIGRDPGAREVSVVVLDLTGAILDQAFGAVALERIVETAESWGAETVFAGISPMSKAVVDDLERKPLFIHKDVEQAIASAFQISDARRRQA
jgi:hypothetical protein